MEINVNHVFTRAAEPELELPEPIVLAEKS